MVHTYKNNGLNIVMDVDSGSIHAVDDETYDIIELLNDGKTKDEIINIKSDIKKSDVLQILDEIDDLINNKQLFTNDNYEEYIDNIIENKKPVVKALCLHIAHDCNLACRYCFADEGEYHGKKELMSLEVGKKALDFLVASSGNRRNLEVDFFGGEPLLNFNVVKELTLYGRSLEKKYNKKFRFTLTTNGVLLNDEISDFINKEMSNVVLSIDGRKEINDKMRPFRGGQGSYDRIVPRYQKFIKDRGDKSYYVRGTFTKNNLDFVEDVKHFIDLGFEKLSIEPVVTQDDVPYKLTDEDVDKICKEYDDLAKYLLEVKKENNNILFFHFMIDLNGGPCVAKRLSGCGSGTEYLAVTPSGDLYPCHQFVGQEEFLLGNVNDGIKEKDIVSEFKHSNVYSKDSCKDCFAKYYCSGGCAANSYNFHKDINKSYELSCVLERKRVECAIMMKVHEMLNS